MNLTYNDLYKIKQLFVGYSIYREYFHNVAIVDCDFKVFANQEVENLYYLFEDIFNKFPEEQLEDFQPKEKFVNIEDIKDYKNEMNGKKVLLVDDFAIDSDVIRRNVQNLERIADIVRIWCLFCDATKFDDNTKDIQDDFSHVIYNTTWEMRTIIGRINNVLNYLNIRTNYNGSKINTDKEINSLLGDDTYYLKKDERIMNYDFSKLMVSFYDKDNILRENGIKFFIRFYQNEKDITIIPTIIFPYIDKNYIVDYCRNILSKFNLSINSEDPDECYKDTIKQLNDFLLNDYLINAQTMEKINIEEKESNPDIKKCIYNALYNNDKSIDFNTLINNITISSNFDEKDVIIQIIMLIDENKLLLQDSYSNYGTEIKKTILFYRIIYELYPNATILFEDNVYDRKFFEYCASYMLEHFADKEYLNLLYCLPKDMNKVVDEFLSLQEFVKTLKCDHSSSYLYSKKLRNEYYDLDCKKKKLSIF